MASMSRFNETQRTRRGGRGAVGALVRFLADQLVDQVI
jgi:hypothetical protein